jgi:type IV secretory pathway VirB4 component
MQQDLEDKKNEIIIEGLEKKIKDHEATLEKKDFILQTMKGSLAEAQAEIARLNSELSMQKKILKPNSKLKLRKIQIWKITERTSRKMRKLRQPVPAVAKTGFQLSWSQR